MTMMYDFPQRFMIVDTSAKPLTGEILLPFAFDEVYCRRVGAGELPVVHLWTHEKAFVLGLNDRRLPEAAKGIEWLEQQGYAVCTRNSGGAAVPLDSGVLNISLILPKRQGALDFHPDFKLMAEMIREVLRIASPTNAGLAVGEIGGSYCPGLFDLSIGGMKFCGISQRRQTQALVVQAFVLVEGSGDNRARTAQEFYRIASGGSTEIKFPDVRMGRMGSLRESAQISTVGDFVKGLKKLLVSTSQPNSAPPIIEETAYRVSDQLELQQMAAQLKLRYEAPHK